MDTMSNKLADFLRSLLSPKYILLVLLVTASITLSLVFPVSGKKNIAEVWSMTRNLLMIIPGVLIIMGIFSVWISADTVEKYMGADAGSKGLFAALGFGFVSNISIFMAFPMGNMLYSKKARVANIFIFFGALAVPFTVLMVEAQFMGFKWMAVRVLLTFPIILIAGYLGEKSYYRSSFGKPIPEFEEF